MQEWMAVIDAAIQGVPEQAHRRRETVTKQFRLRQVRIVCMYTYMYCTCTLGLPYTVCKCPYFNLLVGFLGSGQQIWLYTHNY